MIAIFEKASKKPYRITVFVLALCLCMQMTASCTTSEPEAVTGKGGVVESNNPLKGQTVQLYNFDYADITITDSVFKDTLDEMMAYYLGIDNDDALFEYRRSIGLDTKGGKTLNTPPTWYGHGFGMLGYWVSAYSIIYRYTGDEAVKDKADNLVNGLYEGMKRAPGMLQGLVNHYAFEKLIKGMLNNYIYCGNETALLYIEECMQWARNSLSRANVFGNNGGGTPPLPAGEWYTVGEACYWAGEVLRNNEYIEFGKEWDYNEFWDIFYNDMDVFDYSPDGGSYPEFFHAFSHINSFNSAAKAYELNGERKYLDTVVKFYDWLQKNQVMVTGAVGPEFEHLLPLDRLINALLGNRSDSAEQQCTCYGSSRLANYLNRLTGEARYGDWTEQMLWNQIVATIPMTPEGNVWYYANYSVQGGSKTNKTETWTCCAGTRPLVVLQTLQNIYFHDTHNLYINLFESSVLEWNRSAGKVRITQESSLPKGETTCITVNLEEENAFSVKFRKPSWLESAATIKVNGEEVNYDTDKDGWLVVNRTWKDGDKVEACFPMGLRISSLGNLKTGRIYAVMYGPYALAAKNILGAPNKYMSMQDALTKIQKTEGELLFTIDGVPSLTFRPYYMFKEEEFYYLYVKEQQS